MFVMGPSLEIDPKPAEVGKLAWAFYIVDRFEMIKIPVAVIRVFEDGSALFIEPWGEA
jgi:purine nucleoside permease